MIRVALFTFLILCGCGKDIEGRGNAVYKNNAGMFYADGDPTKKCVALTFDDGPNPAVSARILDILRTKKVPASFFILGVNARAYPQYVKMYIDNGHEVGNHTYSHKNFYRLKKIKKPVELEKIILKELIESDNIISGIISRKPVFIRMPNGFISPEVEKVATENGYTVVNWSFGCDWKSMTKENLVKNYITHIKPGAILLFHEKRLTATALPEIIDGIRNKGYDIVPLRQILPAERQPR